MLSMKSENNSLLRPIEKKIVIKLGNLVPKWIGTKILTFLALFSSFIVFIGYYLSTKNPLFLLLANLGILLQWIFDCLDGHIGRKRNEGFVKWGFYMDHFFDYLFFCSLILGLYHILFISNLQQIIFLMVFSATILSFTLFHDMTSSIYKKFKISFGLLSPIEYRLFVITLNTFFIFTNLELVLSKYFNLIIFFQVIILILMTYNNQKILSELDIKKLKDEK